MHMSCGHAVIAILAQHLGMAKRLLQVCGEHWRRGGERRGGERHGMLNTTSKESQAR